MRTYRSFPSGEAEEHVWTVPVRHLPEHVQQLSRMSGLQHTKVIDSYTIEDINFVTGKNEQIKYYNIRCVIKPLKAVLYKRYTKRSTRTFLY